MFLVLLVFRLHGLEESDGLGGDDMLERSALDAGEDAGVEDCAHLLDFALRGGKAPGVVEVLAHQDDAAARSTKGLVGGGGDNVGVFHRILQEACGNQAGGMGHVDPEEGTYFIGNLAHALIVPFAGVGGGTADDEFRLALQRLALPLIIVDAAGFGIKAVGNRFVQDAGCIDRGSVGKVSAHGEVESHEDVARTEAGHDNGHIGLGTGVRLDIGVLGIIQFAETVDGELLNLVHHLAPAIIALSGIPFGVLVGADGAHGFHYLVGNIVFRGNQFKARRLAVVLFLDEVEDLKILFHN